MMVVVATWKHHSCKGQLEDREQLKTNPPIYLGHLLTIYVNHALVCYRLTENEIKFPKLKEKLSILRIS